MRSPRVDTVANTCTIAASEIPNEARDTTGRYFQTQVVRQRLKFSVPTSDCAQRILECSTSRSTLLIASADNAQEL